MSSQQKIVNNLVHFKLIISNTVKTKNVFENKILPINGILFNGVLIPNLLNNLLASWYLMNLDFFIPQITQCHIIINIFFVALLALEFLLSTFSYNWHKLFPLFLYSIFNKVFRIFNFFFRSCYILLISYSLKQILYDKYKSRLRL